ncbi:MAG: hypothetical protein IPL32_13705 [Chloracidobacterium sp.]|nr:hypothetical protein [Chloracidobacterium sp.]
MLGYNFRTEAIPVFTGNLYNGESVIIDGVAYTPVKYSKNQIRNAGKALLGKREMPSDEMFAIVNNWRFAHRYPLMRAKRLLERRAHLVDPQALVVDRLKRLPSIETKLKLQPTMQLSNMQDIAGCRVIVASSMQLIRLMGVFISHKNRLKAWERLGIDDYIGSPKPDGYRSLHLIYQYKSDSGQSSAFDGLTVEFQLRTHIQHVWATAVEVVSTFTQQDLKRGIGDPSWKRFFALASQFFSGTEDKTAAVPNTPVEMEDLMKEIIPLWDQLEIVRVLQGFTEITIAHDKAFPGASHFVTMLNSREKKVSIKGFTAENVDEAWKLQTELEAKYREDLKIDVVFASADSLRELRDAFPNYYGDTKEFVTKIWAAVNYWREKLGMKEVA